MKKFYTILSLLALFNLVYTQVDLNPERFAFEPNLNYNPNITSPEEFLGYELGESFTFYANAVQYFKELAQQSSRVKINQYGETYEGRKLYNLIISSEENQSNLEEIIADNNKLSDPRTTNSTIANDIIENKPVFVSYSYNIHGNEASSTEAAMQVAYRLAAVDDSETAEILNKAIMIFYICINPDGRDRYVYWYEGAKRSIPAASPSDLDHHAPWPNGRTNHYWFDLNRDWIWGVHPESRGHTGEYQKWMPQLHVDYHEQGYNNNYFTVPGTTPRNLLLPEQYESLADTIGRANVAAFDKHKINYFTREAFDFFYPGYGSSYPTVMGAIGMLTEQGGISGGRAIKTNDGVVLTLRQRVFDHYTTSLATIKKAAERPELFNRYFYNTLNPSKSKSRTKTYIVRNEKSGYIKDFVNVLLRNGIEVEKANSSFSVSSALNYKNQRTENPNFTKGDFLIKTNQPRHLLINTILGAQLAIEDSVMYDMSTWSAPMAYNLEAYSTSNEVSVSSTRVTDFESEKSEINNNESSYAYIIDWDQRFAPNALSELWEKGYNVRIATEKFDNNGVSYDRGALIILTGRNLDKKDDIAADMTDISASASVVINGTHTGRAQSGIDLASRDSEVLHPPKVALLVDQPFSTYTCGQIYFLFDQDTKFPIDRVRTSILKQTSIPKLGSRYGYADLEDYDVLILSGGGGNLSKVFDKEAVKTLKDWVNKGGTIVATESATDFFTSKTSEEWAVKLSSVSKDTTERAATLTYEDRTDYYGKKRIPGAAMNATLDLSHPLAYGLKKHLFTLKFGNKALSPSVDLESVGRYNSANLLASGYASQTNLKHLSGKTFAGVDRIGDGKIVYLMDNTQYRMFWKGPARMMQNAVMLMPSL